MEIEEIRGVKSDRAIYTLSEKKLIEESGRKNVPGRPIIYVTTDEFLKHFNFYSLDEMPSLEDLNKENTNMMIKTRKLNSIYKNLLIHKL